MVDISKLKDPSPWHPMRDPVDLKTLGKFLEELGECTAAASRCLIQGSVDAEDPITGKLNRVWLEDEIADVIANANLVKTRFKLNKDRMDERIRMKMAHLITWHKLA